LRDLGSGGAGIEVLDAAALPHGTFSLHYGDEVRQAAVAWRNCTRAGVRFGAAQESAGKPPLQGQRAIAI